MVEPRKLTLLVEGITGCNDCPCLHSTLMGMYCMHPKRPTDFFPIVRGFDGYIPQPTEPPLPFPDWCPLVAWEKEILEQINPPDFRKLVLEHLTAPAPPASDSAPATAPASTHEHPAP